jgi:hypothetical protein
VRGMLIAHLCCSIYLALKFMIDLYLIFIMKLEFNFKFVIGKRGYAFCLLSVSDSKRTPPLQ